MTTATVTDEKYVVFKIDDLWKLRREPEPGSEIVGFYGPALDRAVIRDAVVIRRQDLFAAAAFDAYANSIAVAINIIIKSLNGVGQLTMPDEVENLMKIADYFNRQAEQARIDGGKIPD